MATGATSRHAYVRHLLDAAAGLGLPLRTTPDHVRAVSSVGFGAPAARPLNARLDPARFERAFGLRMPPWQDGVGQDVAATTATFGKTSSSGVVTQDSLGVSVGFNSFDECRAAMIAAVPALAHEGIAPMAWNPPKLADKAEGVMESYPIKDFYLTNPIARASQTMQRCSAELLHGEEMMEAAQ